jgi:hypothetical protein
MRPHARKGSTDSLHYLQQMLGELRSIAEAEHHAMLAYLIEMAYIEVSDIIGGKRPSRLQDEERDGPAGVPLQPTRKV